MVRAKSTGTKSANSHRYWLDPVIYADSRFRELEPLTAYLLVYLHTGPLIHQSRIPGLLRAGVGTLTDYLKWKHEDVQAALTELAEAGLVSVDDQQLLIWIPAASKANPPDNPSMVHGWRETWNAIAEGHLRDQIRTDLYNVVRPRGENFVDAFRKVSQRVTRDSVEHGVHHGGGRRCGYTVSELASHQVFC